MGEADKFWKKSFPDTERTDPSLYCRLAFPINDKGTIDQLANLLKSIEGSPYNELKRDGKEEFFDLDFEVFDDRVVVKFMKCAMQDWNGDFIEKLK